MPLFSERQIARIERISTSGRVIPYLAAFTIIVTIGAALFVEVFSPNSFNSPETRFGAPHGDDRRYGDVVPQTNPAGAASPCSMVFESQRSADDGDRHLGIRRLSTTRASAGTSRL
jgi:hypothetical protein